MFVDGSDDVKRLCFSVAAKVLSLVSAASLVSCSVGKSLKWENSLFVRVPGRAPSPTEAYREAPSRSATSGWCFKHVVAGPRDEPGLPEAQWYLTWEKNGRHKIGNSLIGYPWTKVRKLTPEIADAAFATFGVYPQVIEPNSTFSKKSLNDPIVDSSAPGNRRSQSGRPKRLEIEKLPLPIWPAGRRDGKLHPTWHLEEEYTQLKNARKRVLDLPGEPEKSIHIGILDAGFDNRHLATPSAERLTDEPRGDAIYAVSPTSNYGVGGRTPGAARAGHGTGTLGLLAGGRFQLVDEWNLGGRTRKQDSEVLTEIAEIGGAPDAQIVTARVAPYVASVSTANLAYAIDYASRIRQCDVISMSHGGSPSNMWMDATNAAYERGTALFAAASDFFNVPWSDLGFPPSATVYPAACRRVMGVAGVTARQRSYALTDWKHFGIRALLPWKWFFVRGSYGADGVWRDMFHRGMHHERKMTDPIEVCQLGELRANPIAAYGPGTLWPGLPDEKRGRFNLIGLDGGGTSAATPQAAAAAALWLAYNRDAIEAAGHWKDWQKPEALYVAMLLSAYRDWAWDTKTGQPIGRAEDQLPNTYIGAGILKTGRMLDVSFDQARAVKGKTLRFPCSSTGARRDRYDGARGFTSMLIGAYSLAQPDEMLELRLDAAGVCRDQPLRATALKNIFFNQLLTSQWQWGMQPRKKEVRESRTARLHKWFRKDEVELDAKADALAARFSGQPPKND